MQAWMGNKKLYFIEQDEELFLDGVHAHRLIELLSDPKTPRWRAGTLLMAMVCKVYGGRYADAEEESRGREKSEELLETETGLVERLQGNSVSDS